MLETHRIPFGETDNLHNVVNNAWENTVYHHSENTPYASAFACSLDDRSRCTNLDDQPAEYYMMLQSGNSEKTHASMGNWWSFVDPSVLVRLGKEFLL